jgi:hypothetical protein
MMRDLSSKPLIVAKGFLFLVLALMAAALLVLETPSLRAAVLMIVLVWSIQVFATLGCWRCSTRSAGSEACEALHCGGEL